MVLVSLVKPLTLLPVRLGPIPIDLLLFAANRIGVHLRLAVRHGDGGIVAAGLVVGFVVAWWRRLQDVRGVATVVVVLDRESHAVRDDGPVLLATAAHDLTRAVKKIDVSGMGFERRACLPAHAISRPGPGRYVALMGRIDDHLAQEHLTVA